MRIVLPLLLCLALPGCLTTPRPVFDATNSVAAADSIAFARVAHRLEVRVGDGHAPGEMIAGGARVVEQDDIVVVQELRQEGAEYFGLGLIGGRPAACFVDDAEIGVLAEEHGVTVDVETDASAAPPTVAADGSDEGLYDFILAVFASAKLTCSAGGQGG